MRFVFAALLVFAVVVQPKAPPPNETPTPSPDVLHPVTPIPRPPFPLPPHGSQQIGLRIYIPLVDRAPID